MASKKEVFNPGDIVPVSGIYDVIHDTLDGQEHTHSHQITAMRGKIFPPCRGCQNWVRYELHLAAESLDDHELFKR